MITLDDRIAAGMRAQLAYRREKLRAGDRPLGWKVGFGSPAARERLGIDRPLVGFLLSSNLLPDGAEVSLADWAAPALEPEIAVHLAHDLPAAASTDTVRQAIRGLSAAIELVDVDPPPTDVRQILAGNIFHRHVLLGPVRQGWAAPEGLQARVLLDGDEIAATDDVTALTGETVEVVRLTAELLELCGDRLRRRRGHHRLRGGAAARRRRRERRRRVRDARRARPVLALRFPRNPRTDRQGGRSG